MDGAMASVIAAILMIAIVIAALFIYDQWAKPALVSAVPA